ncbi:sphingomyelin phosphodiesterase [Athelia psychrophila]|uniref:Sphingomyelin phosphodiesterase n=1 Tax=Athelia psychrophila TaxID=1759441 RepID=A0A166RS92_9AGAM|nr:sphingomyelin phosphodiesterase [Fibularhizoctonia sp. CBS 109695]
MLLLRFWAFLFLVLSSLTEASLIDEIIKAIEDAVDCTTCHALLIPLQVLAHLGDTAFVDTVTTICQTLKAEDDDVCAGLISEQGPIIAQDLRQISATGQTSTRLCSSLVGLCQPPAVNPYNVSFPKTAPSAPKVWVSSGQPPFQVLHFSDVHIDRQYTPGSEANCTKPICCRNFADNTGTPTEPAGPYGNSKCDSPVPLVDSMLDFAQQTAGDAKFAIFTGDVVEAALWLVNQSDVTGDLQQWNSELASKLQPTVFPSFGNHDTAPVNSFPRNTSAAASGFQWTFDVQSAAWENWIGEAAASEVQHGSGSYSALVSGTKLRIISVNTQYWYIDNYYLYDSDTLQPDPNGVLAFIIQQLQATEDAGQRAWIIGHVPTGSGDFMRDQSNYYDQILQRYKNSIAGHFFGHTHMDEFEIGYSDYNNQQASTAIAFGSLSPALTPRSGNPAFKMYDVDPDTFELMDVKVYTTNMSDPSYQNNPTWELYYSARETYAPLVPSLSANQSLSPAFWHNLTEVFASNDTAFQMYNTFKSRDGAVESCVGSCQNTTICGMRAMRSENNCGVVTPGLPSRRSLEPLMSASHGYDMDCEGAGIGHIMKKMTSQTSPGSVM